VTGYLRRDSPMPRNNFFKRALTWNPDNVLAGARHLSIGGHYLYIATDKGVVIVDIDDPLNPQLVTTIALNDVRATMLQFRYLFVTTDEGLMAVDVSNPSAPRVTENNLIQIDDAQKVFVSRTYAYVAAGAEGLIIVDVEKPESMRVHTRFSDGLKDSRDVIVASTNASLFAYVADGSGGLKVIQLTSPELQPKFYGFSPEPNPRLIARHSTGKRLLSLSRPLERDRGVDESGNQIAVFGRRGSRPLNNEEMRKMYLNDQGQPWFVTNDPAQ
jgi:hypothetical protein